MERQRISAIGTVGVVVAAVGAASGGCGSTGMASAGSGSDPLAMMPDVPGALIQMRRVGCAPERCPVYGVSIFMDGTVTYDGRANVATLGQRRAKLSADRVSELVSAIDAMRFLDTAERCCICPDIIGARVILDYRPGSAQKTVIHDAECRSAPPTMSALEATIDRLANVAGWTLPVTAEKTLAAPEDALEGPAASQTTEVDDPAVMTVAHTPVAAP